MRLAKRTIVAAVFIGGLLMPAASAQSGPQVVAYTDLVCNGGSVFGYANSVSDTISPQYFYQRCGRFQ